MMAVNRFKSLRNRKTPKDQGQTDKNGTVEADAETKKENRISVKSIPEDDNIVGVDE